MNPFEPPKRSSPTKPITKTARRIRQRRADEAANREAETIGLVVLLVIGALVAVMFAGRI